MSFRGRGGGGGRGFGGRKWNFIIVVNYFWNKCIDTILNFLKMFAVVFGVNFKISLIFENTGFTNTKWTGFYHKLQTSIYQFNRVWHESVTHYRCRFSMDIWLKKFLLYVISIDFLKSCLFRRSILDLY